MAESFCAIDDKAEPITEQTFLVCFECGHVYETEKDLLDADYETAAEHLPGAVRRESASAVFFCPLCLHDF